MLTREQLVTDKIFKNKTADWFVKIVHVGKTNLIFQYSGKLEDLVNGIAQEDSGSIIEFCEKFGIYEPPKRPDKVTLYQYLMVTKNGEEDVYMLTNWVSKRRVGLDKEELGILKEYTMEVEL